jgi:hypothetical protein
MSITQKEIHKCDNCGKEEERESSGHISHWFNIEIWQYDKNMGRGIFSKEVCSKKCLTEIMKKFRFLKPEPRRMICHPI